MYSTVQIHASRYQGRTIIAFLTRKTVSGGTQKKTNSAQKGKNKQTLLLLRHNLLLLICENELCSE